MKHLLILLIVNCFICQVCSSPILNQPKRPTRGIHNLQTLTSDDKI